MNNSKEKKGISTCCVCDVGEKKIFWAKNINGLFEWKDGMSKFVLREPGTDSDRKLMYNLCARYKTSIVFVPFNSDKICVYNFATQKANFIPIKGIEKLVCGVYCYENQVFVFGYNNTYVIDMCKETIREVTELKDLDIYGVVYGARENIFYVSKTKGLSQINVVTYEKSSIKCKQGIPHNILGVIDDMIWIEMDDEKIVSYDLSNNEEQIYQDSIFQKTRDFDNRGESLFYRILKGGNILYLIPRACECLVSINIETGNIEECYKFRAGDVICSADIIDGNKLFVQLEDTGTYNIKKQICISEKGVTENEDGLYLTDDSNYVFEGINHESKILDVYDYMKAVFR